MKEIVIRETTQSDASELSHMITENALHVLKPYYTNEQWSAFRQYYSPFALEEKIAAQTFFCAVSEGRIVGCIALDRNMIAGFYTRLEWRKKGIGQTLMAHLVNHARDIGLEELYLAAAPQSFDFYYKNGWQKIKDIVTVHHGVGFPETLMKRTLVSRPLVLHRPTSEVA